MNSNQLVSIIIPSFNQGRYIRETVLSCLDQDYRPLEVLVLDGASTDETVEVLRSIGAPELRWWSESDTGVADAVNRGLLLAKGSILGIQSSDDAYCPGAVREAVRMLLENPSAGLAYGDIERMDTSSRTVRVETQGAFDLCEYLGRFTYVPQPAAFFTRAAMESAGQWREEVSYAADADFWLRIAIRFPVVKIDRVMGRYRDHETQRNHEHARICRDWGRMARDLMASGVLDHRQTRFVRMGMHLAQYRYAAESQWGRRTLALYRALIANPLAVGDRRFPKRELFPGRYPIWRALSLAKRRLGFKPRVR